METINLVTNEGVITLLIIIFLTLFFLFSPNIVYFIHKEYFLLKKDGYISLYEIDMATIWFDIKAEPVKNYLTNKYFPNLQSDNLHRLNKLTIYRNEHSVTTHQ